MRRTLIIGCLLLLVLVAIPACSDSGKIHKLETQIQEQQAQIADLQSDMQNQETQITSLKSDLAQAQQTIVSLQADKDTLTKDKADLQAQITGLANDKTNLQTQIDTLNSDKTSLQADIDSLQANVSALQTELDRLKLRVHFIDVGQGDAILIMAPDGKTMLIDGGESDSGIVNYLHNNGVDHLDLVVATHPHSDHIGGLVQVLKTIAVDKVVTNGQAHTTVIYEQFLDAIADAKAEYIEVKRRDPLFLGELSFAVLNPVIDMGDDLNDNSIVLRLVYGKTSFLFMGDAGTVAEAEMLSADIPLQANILKVGHHGSRYGSSPSFLAKVKPEAAIYCAGTGNSYGHPHAETLAVLAAVGAHIYGTDVNGTVIVTSDGDNYEVEVAKSGQPRAPPTVQP